MSDSKAQSPQVADYYDDLYVLGGAVLDKASYEKHKEAASPAAAEISTPAAEDPFAAPQDLRQMAAQAFEADQQAEYRPETASFVVYTSEDGEYEQREYVEGTETYCPGEMRIVLGAPCIVRRGSGSYRTSGSYRLSSGSYRISSGSFRLVRGSYRLSSGSYRISSGLHRHQHEYEYRLSSGSYRRSSGSYRRSSGSFRFSSGSYRRSSGSFRFSSGSYRLSSGSFRLSSGSYRISGSGHPSFHADFSQLAAAAALEDQPYMGSLYWGSEAGGYGLNLI